MSLQRRNSGSNSPRPSPQKNGGIPTPGSVPAQNTIQIPGAENLNQPPQPHYDSSSRPYGGDQSYGNQGIGVPNQYDGRDNLQNGLPNPSLQTGIPNQPMGNQGQAGMDLYGGNNTLYPNPGAYDSHPQQMGQMNSYERSTPPQDNRDLPHNQVGNGGFGGPNVDNGPSYDASYDVLSLIHI